MEGKGGKKGGKSALHYLNFSNRKKKRKRTNLFHPPPKNDQKKIKKRGKGPSSPHVRTRKKEGRGAVI